MVITRFLKGIHRNLGGIRGTSKAVSSLSSTYGFFRGLAPVSFSPVPLWWSNFWFSWVPKCFCWLFSPIWALCLWLPSCFSPLGSSPAAIIPVIGSGLTGYRRQECPESLVLLIGWERCTLVGVRSCCSWAGWTGGKEKSASFIGLVWCFQA